MASIYASAQTVLVWLGAAGDNSNLAIDEIKRIESFCRGLDTSELKAKQAVKNFLPEEDDPALPAVVKLFDRQWFKRIWIMQEVILARRVHVYCGHKSLPWSTLADFGESMMEICPGLLFLAGPSDTHILFLFRDTTWRFSAQTSQGTTRPSLRHTWSTRPYNSRICSHQLSAGILGRLPSWCPNFNDARGETIGYNLIPSFNAGGFADGEGRKAHVQLHSSSHLDSIQVGFQMDTVKRVVGSSVAIFTSRDQLEHEGLFADCAKNLAWERECWTIFYEDAHKSLGGNNIPEDYLRALIANHFTSMEAVPLNYSLRDDYLAIKAGWTSRSKFETPTRSFTYSTEESRLRYLIAILNQKRRKFFSTEAGRVGMGPRHVKPGDRIVTLYGGAPVFILRVSESHHDSGETESHVLIGDAFVGGLMDLSLIPESSRNDRCYAGSGGLGGMLLVSGHCLGRHSGAGLPVPEIYGYSATSEKAAGTEYIFMEPLRGKNFGGIWLDLSEDARITTVTKLVEDPEAALTAGAKKEIAYLKKFGRPLQPFQLLRWEIYDYQKQSHLEHIDGLEKYLEIAPQLIPNDNDALARPTIRHPDLQPNNVFVSDDLEITGLIDWQQCAVLPLFLQCGIPNSPQNCGDSVSESLKTPELPHNFDYLDEREQFEQAKLLRTPTSLLLRRENYNILYITMLWHLI
ncbi:uncharacterized protein BP5553_00505 [Venustampulla echinocandica]|uniref:Heterokaryon incompatibility domain-containing protein n=1 Tax=Venustampulla echinocandica TaxID=2656787 RepID=A0A370TYC0_9HELO|nr:uncharacterized protein BP5553_00505 [Venustampulla echinocandica]RDL40526.1 hypothetical protein BP5553_00505 [Venustampulla echinocandica]